MSKIKSILESVNNTLFKDKTELHISGVRMLNSKLKSIYDEKNINNFLSKLLNPIEPDLMKQFKQKKSVVLQVSFNELNFVMRYEEEALVIYSIKGFNVTWKDIQAGLRY